MSYLLRRLVVGLLLGARYYVSGKNRNVAVHRLCLRSEIPWLAGYIRKNPTATFRWT